MNIDAVREKLAAHRLTTPSQCLCGEREPYKAQGQPDWHAVHLLPVVREIAAEELRGAARDDSVSTHRLTPVEVLTLRVVKVYDLWNRADALTEPPGATP